MIVGNKNDRAPRTERVTTNRFNVLYFKNYDGTTTVKVVTREQYNRMMGVQ